MATNDSFKRISYQLRNFDEVQLIYYTYHDPQDGNKPTIIYNVVCDLDSVVTNESLLKTYDATRELLRTLYSEANINLVFNIISLEEFEDNILSTDEAIPYSMNNGNVLYAKDEDLEAVVKGKGR